LCNALAQLGQVVRHDAGNQRVLWIARVPLSAQPFPKFKEIIDAEITAANALIAKGTAASAVHQARSRANLKGKAGTYWNSLVLGKAAPRPRRPVDPTVWKATVDGHEPVKGPKNALVTIVEFTDFQ